MKILANFEVNRSPHDVLTDLWLRPDRAALGRCRCQYRLGKFGLPILGKMMITQHVFGVSAGSPRFQTKPRSLQHSSRLIFTNFKDQLILSKVFKPWNPTDYHHVPHKTCHLGIYPPEISPVRRREPDDPMQTAWALGSTGHDFGWILCGFWGLTGAFNPQRCVWTFVQRSKS